MSQHDHECCEYHCEECFEKGMAEGKPLEEMDIQFTRPESYVVSMRLNREESRVLTEAARFHGMKLSTYIKQQALREARRTQVRFSVNYGAFDVSVA